MAKLMVKLTAFGSTFSTALLLAAFLAVPQPSHAIRSDRGDDGRGFRLTFGDDTPRFGDDTPRRGRGVDAFSIVVRRPDLSSWSWSRHDESNRGRGWAWGRGRSALARGERSFDPGDDDRARLRAWADHLRERFDREPPLASGASEDGAAIAGAASEAASGSGRLGPAQRASLATSGPVPAMPEPSSFVIFALALLGLYLPLRARAGAGAAEQAEERPALLPDAAATRELRLAVKRALDMTGALVGLTLSLPVIALGALAIRLDSPGPVLFAQERCGRDGRRFRMWKLRTMQVDAEARQAELAERNEMDGPVFKVKDDPRVTRVGRWLRRYSIDELPQFWNVLSGDMSLVGPRPPIPAEVDRYGRRERRRLEMKPGLTCTWQVSGRNLIGFQEWVAMDIAYIDDWTLRRDLELLWKTLPAVARGTGAS